MAASAATNAATVAADSVVAAGSGGIGRFVRMAGVRGGHLLFAAGVRAGSLLSTAVLDCIRTCRTQAGKQLGC